VQQAYQAAAIEEVQKEHSRYFSALEQPARLLVGTKVPRLDGQDGEETLRDEADVNSWKEALRHVLVQEVQDRAGRTMDENRAFIQTVHASIDLFRNNADLIPGTPKFDKDLAERFTTLAAPYEVRVEDKLQGYSVPVQPLIEQLRAQLVTERAAATPNQPADGATSGAPAPAEAGAAPAATAPASPPEGAPEPPQAGIQSKAGQADEREDFSTLWGTISPELRNFQI